MDKKFECVAMNENNSKWLNAISREEAIYKKPSDIRSEFDRDYTRILHSTAYRRLKHKTQVFFSTHNDHICTRMEHVNHVSSVSYTIAKYLGLNVELTTAIATGHDLGHSPFGHCGENILKGIIKKELRDNFWHERNSLRFVDCIETLPDYQGKEQNLDLTYAVRDGIISHCGEVDEESLFPRRNKIDLTQIKKPNQYKPYTWEACIVKISDKISYLGRDIEDAYILGILTHSQVKELIRIVKKDFDELNNTVLIHNFIIDLCKNSSPEAGIRFSREYLELINAVKQFNYDNIYRHSRLEYYKKYAELIIDSIYQYLKSIYKADETIEELKKLQNRYPGIARTFMEWLEKYSNLRDPNSKYSNKILYDIKEEKQYILAIIDYISGMTDNFACKAFEEISSL